MCVCVCVHTFKRAHLRACARLCVCVCVCMCICERVLVSYVSFVHVPGHLCVLHVCVCLWAVCEGVHEED